MKNKIILLLVTSMLMVPLFSAPSKAAEGGGTWITVSSWAYNSVSNYKKEKLLPESFNDISDYTKNITRLQFAELMYSVLLKTKAVDDRVSWTEFNDTDNIAAKVLADYDVMNGEDLGTSITEENGRRRVRENRIFYPDRLLTREEMAAVVYRAVQRWCSYLLIDKDTNGSNTIPVDYNEVSDWAKESILVLKREGLISGMDDGTFAPRSNLTIEQAVTVLYSFFNCIPTAFGADGANLHSEYEQEVQRYENGMIETKQGDILYLKTGDNALMEFETDIYSNIYCQSVGETVYAAAQNIFDKTDVYNAETRELLFKIPYPVYAAEYDYIVTKSSNTGPMTYGLYSYGGEEILPPEYSLEELEIIKNNNLVVPEETKRAASGRIYYSDWNDGGHMYRIDSNGENRQKLSDNFCSDIEYVNGWLYYSVSDEDGVKSLYCMREDGTNEQKLSDDAYLIGNIKKLFVLNSENAIGYDVVYAYGGEKHYSISSVYEAARLDWNNNRYLVVDGSVYIRRYDYETGTNEIYRIRTSDDTVKTERILKEYNPVMLQFDGDKIYFIDFDMEKGGALYRFENSTAVKLSGGMDVSDFGFNDEGIILQSASDEFTPYIIDFDGSDMRMAQEYIDAVEEYERRYDKNNYRVEDILYDISDERYEVSHVWEVHTDENGESIQRTGICITDNEKNETFFDESVGYPQKRIGDTLYYISDASTPDKREYRMTAYDMSTKKSRVVASNLRSVEYSTDASGDDWFTYTDFNFNVWRYNAASDTAVEVFPCKGLTKYGRAARMLGLDSGMYKVDTDGNYSFVCDEYAADCLYVEIGAEAGHHF